MEIEMNSVDIIEPLVTRKLTNMDLLIGKPIEPIKRLQVTSADDFEDMVREWATGYLSQKYSKIRRCGGAGDMGRDVIAFENYDNKEPLVWDNYQCKHYNHALSPGDIWLELGKLCYYTFSGEYSVPRAYYFVAPKGVSTSLGNLIDKPVKLKKELISKWSDQCQLKITKKKEIELIDKFAGYVNAFDFSIIKYIDPQELIEQHTKTKYFYYRFGGIHTTRPEPIKPPQTIAPEEISYISKLLEAYSDNYKLSSIDIIELPKHQNYLNHFERQRKSFYSAESLMRFERDTLPPGVDAFQELKDEVHDVMGSALLFFITPSQVEFHVNELFLLGPTLVHFHENST
jgi:hypothetical protein